MPAVIFSGAQIKALKDQFNLNDTASILTGTDDPSSVAKDAPQGSLYLRTGGSGGAIFAKQDAGSTVNWTEIGTGGGSSGGSQVVVKRGEKMEANAAVFFKVKDELLVTASNNKININEGGGELSDALAVGTYFIDTAQNIQELTDALAAGFNAAGGGGITYTASFNQSTRLIKVTGTGAFTILFKTGTNGSDNDDTHFGNILGYDDVADTGSATDHEADNVIDDTTTQDMYSFGTDTDFVEKSKAYFGIDSLGGAKFSSSTVKVWQEIGTFSGLTPGEERFTTSASITITAASNDALDFNEGGGELNATLTPAIYNAPYDGLLTDIKTQLEAAGAATYTVTFDADDQTFIIASSGAIALPFLTGTNNATQCGTTLGFTKTDHVSAATQTSDNSVDKRGQLTNSQGSAANSVQAGFNTAAASFFPKRIEGTTSYLDVVNKPNSFLVSPDDLDAGEEMILESQHENAVGQGVQLYQTTASGSDFKFRYKTSPNGPWIAATTVISFKDGGSAAEPEDHGGGANQARISKVFMDEFGTAVALMRRQASGGSTVAETWVAQSTDGGDTWINITKVDATNSQVHDLYIREKKAVVVYADTGGSNTLLRISDDSGSGYAVWSSQIVTGDNLNNSLSRPVFCFMQYFPAETGINQHRIVIFGQLNSGSLAPAVRYLKGDGTSSTQILPFGAISREVWAGGIDSIGKQNRIIIVSQSPGATSIFEAESNEDYNAGVMTFAAHANQDIGSTAAVGDDQNGWNAANQIGTRTAQRNRVIIVGERAFIVSQNEGNPSSEVKFEILYTWGLTGGTWETPINVGFTTDTHMQVNLQYIKGINGLVATWIYNTATRGTSETNGQIYARYIQITGNTLSLFDTEQVDGGELMAGDQQNLRSSASADSVNISWERFDSGDSYDHLMTNKFV